MAALRDFQNLQGPVAADKANQVGHSGVPLESGEVCWRQECNFGNLVADAMVHCLLVQTSPATPIEEPVHSVWHGGAFFEETFPSKCKSNSKLTLLSPIQYLKKLSLKIF